MLRTERRHPLLLPVLVLAAAAAVAILAAPEAEAQTLINNGVIQLGVHPTAQLNVNGGTPSSGAGTTVVGLRYMPTNADATSPGCPCEGWGVAYDGATNGWANQNFGGTGGSLAPVSFVATGSTAVSVVQVGDLRVKHDFHPSAATPNLYEVSVEIQNTGTVSHSNVQYRRVMDWDVEPTYFSEYVTIATASPVPSVLKYSSDNGFAHPNPLSGPSSIAAVGPPTGSAFTDNGPRDHGALFDFDFGTLARGGRVTFNIYYGAAGTETAANAARSAVGAAIWSYGQPNTGPSTGAPNTFVFAFGGGAISKSLTCSPASATVAPGTPVTFGVSGGTPGYFWSSPGGSPSGGSGSSYTTSYASPGTYTVTVTDAAGNTGTCTVTVRAPHCSPVSVTAPMGAPVTFTASAGTPGYSWSSPGGSPSGGSGSSYTTSYASPGAYTVTVTDALGGTATCTVTVVTPPVCSGTTSVPVGGTATFAVSGGVPPHAWSSPGGSPAGGTGWSHTTTYGSSGTYTVTVTDAIGQTSTCTVRVVACAMTGRAYVAHLHVEDVGSTGYVGPTDAWSEDTGEVWTTWSERHWAGLANVTGPLVVGDFVAASVETEEGPRCHSFARAGAAHLDNGTNLPAPLAPFRLRAAEAWSESDCRGSRGGTTLAYLMVGGVVLVDTTNTPPPNTQYTVGPVTVILNEHIPGPGVLEVNAVHLIVAGVGDLKVLSARSDIHDCSTAPPDPPRDPCADDGVEPTAGLPRTPNGAAILAPVAPIAPDPCVCKALEAAGLHCDVCPPSGGGGVVCDPCNVVNPCEVCGIHVGTPSGGGGDDPAPTGGAESGPAAGKGAASSCDPCATLDPCTVCGVDLGGIAAGGPVVVADLSPDCLPCVGVPINAAALRDCVQDLCDDLLAQLGLDRRCEVGPVEPIEPPRCGIPVDDPVGGAVGCVDRLCDTAVGLLGPIECTLGPVEPIGLSCSTAAECAQELCAFVAGAIGLRCDLAPGNVPAWAGDALASLSGAGRAQPSGEAPPA